MTTQEEAIRLAVEALEETQEMVCSAYCDADDNDVPHCMECIDAAEAIADLQNTSAKYEELRLKTKKQIGSDIDLAVELVALLRSDIRELKDELVVLESVKMPEMVTIDDIMKKVFDNPHNIHSVRCYFEHAAKHYPHGLIVMEDK